MRKHFLLLFLLTLLPLAGFADEYQLSVTTNNASKTYGEADPINALKLTSEDVWTARSTWFTANLTSYPWATTGLDLSGVTDAAAILAAQQKSLGYNLKFMRTKQGETVGSYTYMFQDENYLTNGTDIVYIIANDEAKFTINRKPLDSFTGVANNKITLKIKDGHEQYVGTTKKTPTAADFDITVDLEVNSLDGTLVEGTDFRIVNYGTNMSVGDQAGEIEIEGLGNYSGTVTLKFPILAADISTLGEATYVGTELVFNNTAKTPSATDFKFGNVTTGFSIKANAYGAGKDYKDNINAGTGYVTLVGNGTDFSGEVEVGFPIAKAEFTNTTAIVFTQVSASDLPQYTGSPIEPKGTVTINSLPAVKGKDYRFTSLKTNAGENQSFTIEILDGNFAGPNANDKIYTIAPRKFEDGTVTVSFTAMKEDGVTPQDQYAYNNEDIKPAYKVMFKPFVDQDAIDITSQVGTQFTAVYKDATSGDNLKSVENDKTLTITGKDGSNFTDDALTPLEYDVIKHDLTITTEELTVGMGSTINPTIVYGTFAQGEDVAVLGGVPTLTYKNKSTSTVYSQAEIMTAPVGEYEVIIGVASLTNTNYKYIVTSGTLHKVASQVIVKVKNQTITYGGTNPTAGSWTLEHVSGLSEKEAEVRTEAGTTEDPTYTSTMETIIAAIDNSKFNITGYTTGKLNANETGYEVTYQGGVINIPNYAVSVQPGKLIVNKKPLTATDITAISAVTYSGKQPTLVVNITPGTGTTDLVDGKLPTNFYTVEKSSKFNAGNHNVHVSLTAAGQANYKVEPYSYKWQAADYEVVDGDKTKDVTETNITYLRKQYTINKVNLAITADDFTGDKAWTYGEPEPKYTAQVTTGAAVEGDESLIAAMLLGQKPAGINATFVVKRISANTVGDHVDALQPCFVDNNGNPVAGNAAATNYNFTALNKGDLTINKGTLVVKVKNATLPYGKVYEDNDIAFELEAVSGMVEAEKANFNTIVDYDRKAVSYGYSKTACAGIDEYTLTYAGKDPTATNYNVVFANGTTQGPATGVLTVTKRPVKFTAYDVNVTYIATLAPGWEAGVTAVNTTNITQTVDGVEFYSLLGEDDVNTVIASITLASKNIGDNEIVLTAKNSDIYDITVENGTLTITNTGVDGIVLSRVGKASFDDEHSNTAAKRIAEADGLIKNVTFEFPGQTMYGEKWYSWVLPFNTTVRAISNAFGYAVVDVFDVNNSNSNDVSFKLHMGAINANEPFILKVDKDITAAEFAAVATKIKFENVLIENSTDPTVADAYGNKFVGTYTGINGGLDPATDYVFGLGKSASTYNPTDGTTYIRPLGAYVKFKDAQTSGARMIYIEEPDGSTTAISVVNTDAVKMEGWYTVNGVKLQNAPTEKGVYIQNGKKVVIK